MALGDDNPDVVRLRAELADLRQQKAEQARISTKEVFGSKTKFEAAAKKELELDATISEKSRELRSILYPPQNSAKGQTADSAVQNQSTPNQTPTPLTSEEKNKVDQSKTGESSAKVNQSQDPIAANKQVAQTNAKSESDYNEVLSLNESNTVVGKDVSGKKSDFSTDTAQMSGRGTVLRNKLLDYTSYTYRITLFFLTAEDYNNLAASPTTFEPRYSLVSSAGGYAQKTGLSVEVSSGGQTYKVIDTLRHPDFRTDFFIDNLNLTTVVGLNAKTKASNAIDISFNIIEPYGLSLLDRLLSACETSKDRNPNYMAQPYLLQVDLLASPTDEQLSRLQVTNNVIDRKRIAIKLLEMKIKPSGSGTTYAIRAIPYNHTAFSMTVASVPVPLNVEAGTVGEFFGGAEDIAKLFLDLKVEENRVEQELQKWITRYKQFAGTPSSVEIENRRRAIETGFGFNTKNFTAAYNVYNENIAKKQKLTTLPPTKIAFNIPYPEIANSPIIDGLAQNTDGGMNDQDASVNQENANLRKKQNFNIKQGTSIIEVVDQVMGKSDYIKNQLNLRGKTNNDAQAEAQYTNNNERSNNAKMFKELKWYKIVPTVALNDFDFKRNNYSKSILYSILPYTAANAYHPNFVKATAQSVADSVVRTYNYFYTGLNQDIIKLDIDFDNTYYTQLTTYRNQVARSGSNSSNDQRDIPETVQSTADSEDSIVNTPPTSYEYTGSNASSNSMNTATNPNEQIIGDLKNSIYTRQRGDALNIKMQIIGDPDFIKQDDVFYNPGGNVNEYTKFISERLEGFSNAPINKSGQILFDAQQVYVRVNFKNAVDIDNNLGLVNKQDTLRNGRKTDGTFTGVYKVLTVHSEFSRGQFTQTLDLVRMPDVLPKAAVPVENKQTINEAQTQSYGNLQAQQISPLQPSPVVDVPNPPDLKLVEAADQPIENNLGAPENANNAQNISPQNTSGLTFQDAFRRARKDFGNKPGGVFEYRGKLYQTNYQNEPFVDKPTPVYPGANQ